MKIHRFIGAFDLTQDRLRLTDPDLVHQMGRVLRLQVGERIVLCDGNGREAEGVIEEVEKRWIVVHLDEHRANTSDPKTQVTLYLALIKRENFELALQKATEVGVANIVPIITERTIKSSLNLERAQVIVREAAEQSGRGRVPVVHAPLSFDEACKQAKDSGAEVLFFDTLSSRPEYPHQKENGYAAEGPLCHEKSEYRRSCMSRQGVPPLRQTSVGTTSEKGAIRAAFIGPEGGWTEAEQALAAKHQFATVSLGPRILRAETAAILATYLLLT